MATGDITSNTQYLGMDTTWWIQLPHTYQYIVWDTVMDPDLEMDKGL